MLNETYPGIWQSTLLSRYPHLLHAFSGRQIGDMRLPNTQSNFTGQFRLSGSHRLFIQQQQHGSDVRIIRRPDRDQVRYPSDATVYKNNKSAFVRPVLSVLYADCVPVILYDPENDIIAVTHSGWRGTLDMITLNVIKAMTNMGSAAKNILAAIGPHIESCCYEIETDRADMFRDKFAGAADILRYRSGKHFVSLGKSVRYTMVSGGMSPGNIDNGALCTGCNPDRFYSYRKLRNKDYGEMMGIITLLN